VTRAAQQAAQQAERFARYTELRDAGTGTADAAVAIGVSDTTRLRYERSYRQARGQPRREPGHSDPGMHTARGWGW